MGLTAKDLEGISFTNDSLIGASQRLGRAVSGMKQAEWDEASPRSTNHYVRRASAEMQYEGTAEYDGRAYKVILDPPLTLEGGQTIGSVKFAITNRLARTMSGSDYLDVLALVERATNLDLKGLTAGQAFWLIRLALYEMGLINKDALSGEITGLTDNDEDFTVQSA